MATQFSGAFTDLGASEDLYYTDPDNCKVESIPVEYNTRFTQNFSNPNSGSSTFIIPPGNGLKHVVICLGYDAATLANVTSDNALPPAWGYAAIRQISFRIGGSSQYFMTGSQLLAKNLRSVRTQTQAQALLDLGGTSIVTTAGYDAAGAQFAYIVVPVWCTPSADGLSVPLPADTLAQQVQITCELNPQSQVFINSSGANAGVIPLGFDTAYFQVEQLPMVDRGMAIANHVDLNSHELLMPITFDQQELQVDLPAAAAGAVQQLTLTGFRSGQVKAIQLWLTKVATPANLALDTANQNVWYLPQAVTVLYAGTIYSQYSNGSSQIWNLLDGTKPTSVSTTLIGLGAAPATQTAVTSQYVMLPFGNPTGNDYEAEVLTHGKPILNGLVNLQIVAPDTSRYTVHVAYVYNSTLVFSKSSAEFRF
jgi:hypothetical protein